MRDPEFWEFELDPFETISQNPERAWGEELSSDSMSPCEQAASGCSVGVF